MTTGSLAAPAAVIGASEARGIGAAVSESGVGAGVLKGGSEGGGSDAGAAVGSAVSEGATVAVGAGDFTGALVGFGAAGTTVVVKWAHRYSRGVSPDARIRVASSRPTYRKCQGS